jgi:hypothetical protein
VSNSSNAATSPDSGQIERLERFFRAYRSAGPSDPTIQKAERLALLFDKIGPLLRQGLPTHPSRILPAQLDGNRLKACLAALKEPLGLARSSGEFTNVWAIAGLKRNEVRNAAVLAWLLDPNGSHGLGHAVSCALLARIDDRLQEGKWSKQDLLNGRRGCRRDVAA